MCGIMGYVRMTENTSKMKPILRDALANIQERGTHASGFTVVNREGAVFSVKHHIPSSGLAHTKWFKKNVGNDLDLMIGHARFATHGAPENNDNNHPFWSKDFRWSIVHNGVLMGGYDDVKDVLVTECDSEVILRYIEKYGMIEGYRKFTRQVMGRYAVLVVDAIENKVFAFRDEAQPLTVVNLSKSVGGIVMASTPTILRKSLMGYGIRSDIDKFFTEVPKDALWEFSPGTKPRMRSKTRSSRMGTDWSRRYFNGNGYHTEYGTVYQRKGTISSGGYSYRDGMWQED